MGVVWQFSPLGEPIVRIQSNKGLATTNVAFGGSDNRTLYVTESETGSILCADMPAPGRSMFSHQTQAATPVHHGAVARAIPLHDFDKGPNT